MLRAVVPLMRGKRLAGFRGGVVHKFVAFAFGHSPRTGGRFARRRARLNPGLAAVIGALNDLAEPAARLRCVNAIGTRGRPFHVIDLPTGKMRAAYVPFLALAVRSEDECTLACANQYAYSAHQMLLSVFFQAFFSTKDANRNQINLRNGTSARKRLSRRYRPSHTSTPKYTGNNVSLKSGFPTRS